MARDDTRDRTGTEQRALAVLTQPDAEPSRHRITGGRPLAPFLAQLIVGNDPSLRPARLERTRGAAALYAKAASRA